MRKAKNYSNIHRRIEPSEITQFIWHLRDLLKSQQVDGVVLYCRVSRASQEAKGNLDDQMDEAIEELRRLGFKQGTGRLAIYDCVESSDIHCDESRDIPDRPILERAFAEAAGHDFVLVAPSRDRLLRSCSKKKHLKKSEEPSLGDYRLFKHLAHGVPVATLLHPSKSARSQQTKRGLIAKDAKPGRPKAEPKPPAGYKKQRRLATLPDALRMRKNGASLGEIARETGLPRSTIQDWIAKYA